MPAAVHAARAVLQEQPAQCTRIGSRCRAGDAPESDTLYHTETFLARAVGGHREERNGCRTAGCPPEHTDADARRGTADRVQEPAIRAARGR